MIVKPVKRAVRAPDAKSFTAIGCPCSEGFGTEAAQMFHAALSGAEGDFVAVLGGVSPVGGNPFYRAVADFASLSSPAPLHVLPGGGDGPEFADVFGGPNRVIVGDGFVLVMLDNSGRRFSDEALELLNKSMGVIEARYIIVAFRYPPPNRFSGNSMSHGDWAAFEEAVGSWRNRISLLLCGHDGPYYEDDIDGLRLVVAGGGAGGGVFERLRSTGRHALEIGVDIRGRLTVRRRELAAFPATDAARAVLGAALIEQSDLHVEYLLLAEEATKLGQRDLARCFRAASGSCLGLARTVRRVARGTGFEPARPRFTVASALGSGRSGELSPRPDAVALHVLRSVERVSRETAALVDAALRAGGDRYRLCFACGMVLAGDDVPGNCPNCGAPAHSLHEIR